jgi:argininosuccinate synthase
VRLKLYKGSVTILGRRSLDSLYREDIATFEDGEAYDQTDAQGFIKLNALRLTLRKRN